MCPSHGDETYVLDACVVIDFCGRTDNLGHLLAYVGDCGVITSVVLAELRRQRERNFSRLGQFLDQVGAGVIAVVDPDLTNTDAARIVTKWSSQFGAGEVSSAAVAVTHGWVFVSRDVAPMRQLRLTETIKMETTAEMLQALVRTRTLSKRQAEAIDTQIREASTRRPRRR
jgi:predicted nucleic acid-binding protein